MGPIFYVIPCLIFTILFEYDNYLDKLHDGAHLRVIEAHVAMESGDGSERLHQQDVLIESRMQCAEHQEGVEGLR